MLQKSCNQTIIENTRKLIKFEQMLCIPSKSTIIFLLSNYMQFGYSNKIIPLIDVLVSMPNFINKACHKKQCPLYSKNYKTKSVKTFQV